MAQKCSVSECVKSQSCRGYCGTHYSRYLRTGDPLGLKRPRYSGIICKINGCKSVAEDNFMCGKHAQRVRRYGDPNYLTPESERIMRLREAQPTLGKLKRTTYKKYLGRHEHRVVAEKMLGRKLRKGEIVHHKDHNKHNNSPENLEVMTQSDHVKAHMVRGKLVKA